MLQEGVFYISNISKELLQISKEQNFTNANEIFKCSKIYIYRCIQESLEAEMDEHYVTENIILVVNLWIIVEMVIQRKQ